MLEARAKTNKATNGGVFSFLWNNFPQRYKRYKNLKLNLENFPDLLKEGSRSRSEVLLGLPLRGAETSYWNSM